jgi:galactose oxidase
MTPTTPWPVQALSSWGAQPRAFANSVVLADGSVLITGGETYAKIFTDNTAVLTPELWQPATRKFTQLRPMPIPRTYYSVALLMPDATVFNGGGGLCGLCHTNHLNGQFFKPPYLFNADGSAASRPTIVAMRPTVAKAGEAISSRSDTPIAKISLIRFSSVTHSVNTDQRHIGLKPAGLFPTYTLTLPGDPGIAIPGYWMVFALNKNGVPSKASTLRISLA